MNYQTIQQHVIRVNLVKSPDIIDDIQLPQYMTPGAVGMDVFSANKTLLQLILLMFLPFQPDYDLKYR